MIFVSEKKLGSRLRMSFVELSAARKKPNQDSYYCETHFAGNSQKAFFAVFDGHGQYGDVCSQFAADKVKQFVSDLLFF